MKKKGTLKANILANPGRRNKGKKAKQQKVKGGKVCIGGKRGPFL